MPGMSAKNAELYMHAATGETPTPPDFKQAVLCVGQEAALILRDGVIRRSTQAPAYVWLSSNPTNEPTAYRAVLSMEQIRQCNERALFALQGRARFVFHGCDATPWVDLQLTSDARRNLKQLAMPKGGRARDWFALPDDVPCADLSLEIETLEGWREIAHDDLKRQYEDLEVTVGDRLTFCMRATRP